MLIRIKKYQTILIISILSIALLWPEPQTKILVLPIAAALLLNKRSSVFQPALFSSIIVSLYFSMHGFSGPHDLKILFLFILFFFITSGFRVANEGRVVSANDMLLCAAILATANVVMIGFEFFDNLTADELSRTRGLFLFPLFTFMFCFIRQTKIKLLLLTATIGVAAFIFSGTRSDSLAMISMIVALIMLKKHLWIVIPIIYVSPQIFAAIYYQADPSNIDNITIRALTQIQIVENLSPFGHGITPDLDFFFENNSFDHYFVPADAAALGRIYEIGYVPFLMQLAFFLLLSRQNAALRNSKFNILAATYFIFGYNLTVDALMLAFSMAVICAFPRLSTNLVAPRRTENHARSARGNPAI